MRVFKPFSIEVRRDPPDVYNCVITYGPPGNPYPLGDGCYRGQAGASWYPIGPNSTPPTFDFAFRTFVG